MGIIAGISAFNTLVSFTQTATSAAQSGSWTDAFAGLLGLGGGGGADTDEIVRRVDEIIEEQMGELSRTIRDFADNAGAAKVKTVLDRLSSYRDDRDSQDPDAIADLMLEGLNLVIENAKASLSAPHAHLETELATASALSTAITAAIAVTEETQDGAYARGNLSAKMQEAAGLLDQVGARLPELLTPQIELDIDWNSWLSKHDENYVYSIELPDGGAFGVEPTLLKELGQDPDLWVSGSFTFAGAAQPQSGWEDGVLTLAVNTQYSDASADVTIRNDLGDPRFMAPPGDDMVLDLNHESQRDLLEEWITLRYKELASEAMGFSPDLQELTSMADKVATLTGGEAKIGSDTANDDLAGGSGNDFLNGKWGADKLEGGDGRDVLYGKRGDDSLKGGNGSDVLRGHEGDDTLADNGYGPDMDNDALFGGAGDDKLLAGEGNDTLDGGAGSDWLLAMEGDNVLRGGTRIDPTISDAGGQYVPDGEADTFIFTPSGTGVDTIQDFESGTDTLEIFGVFPRSESWEVAFGFDEVNENTEIVVDDNEIYAETPMGEWEVFAKLVNSDTPTVDDFMVS